MRSSYYKKKNGAVKHNLLMLYNVIVKHIQFISFLTI